MRDYLIKPLVGQPYPMISHGKGVYLYDQNGNKYFDGSSGAITAGIGHGVKEIADVIKKQAEEIAFVYDHSLRVNQLKISEEIKRFKCRRFELELL